MLIFARLHFGLGLVSGVMAFAPSTLQADLVVTDWNLATRTYDFAQSQFQSSLVLTIENPLQTSRTATIGPSYSTAAYDMGWILDDAHFDITMAHHLEQLDGQTITEGRIHLVPAVDSIVTLQGTFQYAWPSEASGGSVLFMAVFDLQTEESIVFESEFGGNHGLGPPFGTLDVQGSGLLQAGRTYQLGYLARIDHFDPTPPGTFGWGSGEVHFEIAAVPEPSTLGLALLGSALLLRRRAR